MHLSGTGDSVVDFENPFNIAIAHIVGNQASSNFAVKNYDANGNTIDLLVNTIDPYDGILPLDFRDGEHTTRFEVNAPGDWIITVMPVSMARVLTVPGTIEGNGDDVFLITGESPDTAVIKGNAGSVNFAIISYGDNIDLLVNTIDPYEGTVIVDPTTSAMEVKAVGPWTIEMP